MCQQLRRLLGYLTTPDTVAEINEEQLKAMADKLYSEITTPRQKVINELVNVCGEDEKEMNKLSDTALYQLATEYKTKM